MKDCVEDLERASIEGKAQLVRISEPVDPDLEMAEIQRRLYASAGPAVLFERVTGSDFPAVCNLFGTLERCRYLFRDTIDEVKNAISIKADPSALWRSPLSHWRTPMTALRALPREVVRAPVLAHRTTLDALPQIKSWPRDGGAFITLPQVYSEDPHRPDPMHSNLGMYRIQLAGNEYAPNREVGLHYQIHRGIGIHHAAAIARGERLPISIFVGGPPAHTFAAVMPLPEGISELVFGGMLAGRRFHWKRHDSHFVSADADFCIVGSIDPHRTAPEGPFGDHLGYYSETHEFPVMNVDAVFHREGAIWPFTVVGRPPQEDTTFGKMIHELTGPMVPVSVPGLRAMHAVDAAGVHPLLLAVGSERYVPYRRGRPQELLTVANAILGFGQASLAKYLMILPGEDLPAIDIEDVDAFLQALLERIDWANDLHFQTRTTMDTLDYSGGALNEGSKVVMAACGEPRRTLAFDVPSELTLPDGFSRPAIGLPGVLLLQGPAYAGPEGPHKGDCPEDIAALTRSLDPGLVDHFPLVVVVDDSEMCSRRLDNFLWATFTRSDPARDVHGVDAFTQQKHWGCRGPLVVDARHKPWHAQQLVEDPEVTRRVDALAARGGPLHGLF
jgi:4-hydroxy-3-polyprenylbenzoate decarboxylase